MTAKTLEQEAMEAADDIGRQIPWGNFPPLSRQHYINGYLAAAAARDKEIEELRARVKELEEMVPKWVGDAEHSRLLALGWRCGPEVIWHRASGMIEAEWHWLMVPPIPLPEGE